jgi:hypothetical protein
MAWLKRRGYVTASPRPTQLANDYARKWPEAARLEGEGSTRMAFDARRRSASWEPPPADYAEKWAPSSKGASDI